MSSTAVSIRIRNMVVRISRSLIDRRQKVLAFESEEENLSDAESLAEILYVQRESTGMAIEPRTFEEELNNYLEYDLETYEY